MRSAWKALWTIAALTACSGPAAVGPGPSPAPAARPSEMVHAIFDAGSSGLRLQIYKVTRRPDGSCAAAEEPIFNEKTKSGGLAKMSLPVAEEALKSLWAQVEPTTKASITGVALLGTGGFRDAASTGGADLMKQLHEVVSGYKRALGKVPDQDWQACIIGGDAEARYAWLTARELGAREIDRTIETGGQTCQYALGDGRGWSAVLGTNAVKKSPAFDVCLPASPVPAGAPRADACIAAFGAVFAQSSIGDAVSGAPLPEGARIWAMGGSWENLFIDHEKTRKDPPEPWDHAREPKVGASLAIGEVYAFAKRVCGDPPPKYPGDLYEPPYWCLRLSHAVAFAVTAYGGSFGKGVGAAVAEVGRREILDGKESFTRGAAVSALFGECAPKGAARARCEAGAP
jgi:GDA1/CD39 (nucleoside phosphatase) family